VNVVMHAPTSTVLEARAALQPRDLLKDRSLFFILHVLDDLVPFVRACIACGCEPASITVVGIPYSSRLEAATAVEELGCEVHLPTIFPFDAPLVKWISDAIAKSDQEGKRLILVEDGGYALPLLCQLVASSHLNPTSILGAVEQTTRGERIAKALAAGDQLVWPLVSIPECGTKKWIEPRYIALAINRNLRELLRHVAAPEPRKAAVFGAGVIGQFVLEELSRRGVEVRVKDTAAEREFAALVVRQFKPLTDADLSDCDLVVGTTGFTTIDMNVLDLVPDEAIILSASSRQIEIDLQWLHSQATASGVIEPFGRCIMPIPAGRRFVYSVERANKAVTVLHDGYPINFWGLSLPEHVGDAVMALIFEGLATVAMGGLRHAGVVSGATVLREADQRITERWRQTKPNDGIDPFGT
jgi:S-adenosylhomocysteine hydrolase